MRFVKQSGREISEESSCFLWQGGVDKHTRPQFETRGSDQTGQDLEVPVVIFFLFVLNRGRVNNVVIIRIVQSAIHFSQDRFHDPGKFLAIIRGNRANGGLMLFGQNPCPVLDLKYTGGCLSPYADGIFTPPTSGCKILKRI